MEHFIWASVAVAALIIINYRLGQYLNPPLSDEMKTLKGIFDVHRNELHKLHEKVNSIMVAKGFKNDR